MINRDSQIPLYIQLADMLREKIHSGEIKEGEKLPSESEMINTYHLGRLTVRDALSILVNEGLLEKHHGKGTFCKSSIISPKHRIDVVLNLSDISFTPYFLRSICSVLESQNVNIMLSDTQDDTNTICSALEKALKEGSDGIIFQPTSTENIASPLLCSTLEKLANSNIPYIMIDTFYKNVPEAYVVMDDFKAGKMAADYFLGLGHTNLCMIEQEGAVDSNLRLEGFSSRCPVKPYIIKYDNNLYNSIKTMLSDRSDITGIFCFDGMAKNCYDVLNQLNISIPNDISIISIDDTIIAQTLSPTLTSIIHPKEQLGHEAANLLLSIIAGDIQWPQKKIFDPSIAIRKSCAAV